ncbi:MAG: SUMF1/EgtB/PvdO family nonheme iron enzyme [Planctomycetota bacterium]
MGRPRTLVVGLIVLGGVGLYVASLSSYLPPLPSAIPPAAEWQRGPLAAGSLRVDAKGVEQVWVCAGWFRCGTDFDPDRRADWHETPQHDVHVSHGFWIDRCEVSNAAFAQFALDQGYLRRELWSDEGWAWLDFQEKGGRWKRGRTAPGECGASLPAPPSRACA